MELSALMNNPTESNRGWVDLTPLDRVKDATSFLDALQTLYRTHGIGEGLPFSEIEAYWRDESALSEAWLDELGRSLRCERPQGAFGSAAPRGVANRTHRILLDGLDPSQWFRVADQCLYLMSPLQVPEDLVHWGMFTYTSSSEVFEIGLWRAGLVAGLLPLAASLAEGDSGWQDLHAWMAEAGSDPGHLHRLLTKFSMAVWRESDDYCAVLSAHHTLLVLMRLLLRGQGPDWEGWHKCVMPSTQLLSKREATPVDLADHRALQRNQAMPIFRAALSAPDFVERMVQQVDHSRITGLMTELGLSFLLADHPERFQALLDKLDKNVLQAFNPSDELAEVAPDLLFYQVRRRYEQTGWLTFHKFAIPEAVAWYREKLPKIQRNHDRKACIDWLVQRLPQADFVLMLDQFCNRDIHLPNDVLDAIDDIEALQRFLACSNYTLSGKAARRLRQLALPERADRQENEYKYEPDPKLWPVLIEQSKRYPDLFISQTLDAYYLNPQELARWALLWESTTNADSRQHFVEMLFHACKKIERVKGVDVLAFAEDLYRENPTPFQASVDELYEDSLDGYIYAISDRESPLWVLIPKMAARYLSQSTWLSGPIDALNPVPVQKAMASYPEGFTVLEEKAKAKLLPFFNDPAVIACGPALCEMLGKATKILYQPGVRLIARSRLEVLRESGLLELSGKKARKLLLTGLALNTDPDVAPLLRQLIDDKADDDFSRGLALDNLEARGESVAGLDDWLDLTVERLQGLAAEEKIPAAVSKLWNADLAESLRDLGEPGGLYLLSLINSGDGERLPRKARQILQLIPAGRRGDFALLGVNQWIAENGSDKLNVLLTPLFEYGDERVANDLVKACKAWKKKRKTKSSAAIQLLCRLPGNYGVAQAHALWESQQFSESIMNNAQQALTEAAERAGMSFQAFVEQLVPDFGLDREGLVLDVGPYSYQVKIKPDLSLAVTGPNGKTTKSFPKAKADEDPDSAAWRRTSSRACVRTSSRCSSSRVNG
jgi:hypothetical protein